LRAIESLDPLRMPGDESRIPFSPTVGNEPKYLGISFIPPSRDWNGLGIAAEIAGETVITGVTIALAS